MCIDNENLVLEGVSAPQYLLDIIRNYLLDELSGRLSSTPKRVRAVDMLSKLVGPGVALVDGVVSPRMRHKLIWALNQVEDHFRVETRLGFEPREAKFDFEIISVLPQ